ncbi:hypothetical protein CUJ88_33525 [Paraburkholderia hospita]|nr:hypothetical protein CUJ88_33525 [Paraburkholderia hospita]
MQRDLFTSYESTFWLLPRVSGHGATRAGVDDAPLARRAGGVSRHVEAKLTNVAMLIIGLCTHGNISI